MEYRSIGVEVVFLDEYEGVNMRIPFHCPCPRAW